MGIKEQKTYRSAFWLANNNNNNNNKWNFISLSPSLEQFSF